MANRPTVTDQPIPYAAPATQRADFSASTKYVADAVVPISTHQPPPNGRSVRSLARSRAGIGWGVCGLCILVSAIGIIGVVRFAVQEDSLDHSNALAVEALRPGDARSTAIVDAISTPVIEVTRRDERRITRLIGKIMSAATRDDLDRVRSFIDESMFISQLNRSGELDAPLDLVDRLIIRRDFAEVTDGPTPYDNFRLISIKQLNDREVLAYLYAWDDGSADDVSELRWWLARKGDRWFLYDWETIGEGIGEARLYAILCEHQESSGIQNFYKQWEQLAAAMGMEDYHEAERLMLAAQALEVHPLLKDYSALAIGQYWSYLDDWARAKAFFARVQEPDLTPAAILGLAECALRAGEHGDVLRLTERFLSRVGPSPNAIRLRARALERLDRDQDAIDQWILLARLFPDDLDVLNSILALSKPGQDSELESLLEQTSAPAKYAARLAQNIPYGRSYQLEGLARIVANEDGGVAEFFDGIGHQLQYDYPAAAESFAAAVSSADDEELREIFMSRYLHLMTEMGKPIEAYHAVDRSFAFHFITDSYDEGDVTPDHILELVELHAQEEPDEPWLDYYRGDAHVALGQLEEAKRAFSEGLARVDDEDVVAWYREQLQWVQARLPEAILAYRDRRDKRAAFSQLAEHLASSKQFERLAVLAERHRQHEPQDPCLSICSAVMSTEAEDYVAVVESLTKAQVPAEDYYLAQRYDTLLVDALRQTDRWRSYVSEGDDVEARFSRVGQRFSADRRWELLVELISMHKSRGLPHGVRRSWQFRHAVAVADDRKIIEVVEEARNANWAGLDSYWVPEWKEELLRAYVRSERWQDAQALAESLYREHRRVWAPLVLHANRRDTEACEAYLQEISGDPYSYRRAMQDKLMSPLLEDEAFEQLRTKYPAPLQRDHEATTAFILLEQPVSLSAEEISAKLNKTLSDQFDCVSVPGDADRQSFIATGKGATFAITRSGRPLEPSFNNASPTTKDLVARHSEWIAITLVGNWSEDGSSSDAVKGVATSLTPPRALGIYFPAERVLLTEPLATLSRSRTPLKSALREVGYPVSLAQAKGPVETPPHWKRMKESVEMTSEVSAGGNHATYLARVLLSAGPTAEAAWLRVQDVRLSDYGDILLVGEFLVDSQLVAEYTAGAHVLIALGDVHAWRKETSSAETHNRPASGNEELSEKEAQNAIAL